MLNFALSNLKKKQKYENRTLAIRILTNKLNYTIMITSDFDRFYIEFESEDDVRSCYPCFDIELVRNKPYMKEQLSKISMEDLVETLIDENLEPETDFNSNNRDDVEWLILWLAAGYVEEWKEE